MPGAPIDLTTVERVQKLLQDSSSLEPELLQDLITAASRAILNFAKREFVKTEAEEVRQFLACGRFLDLGDSDLRGQPSVVTLFSDRPESDQVILEPSEYGLRPLRPEFGVYEWLELPKRVSGIECHVAIEGEWGFDDIPEDVVHWCGVTVVTWARGDISAFSTSYSVDEGRIIKPADLPAATRYALQNYQRPRVG